MYSMRTGSCAAQLPRCSAWRGGMTPSPASATGNCQTSAPEEKTTPAGRFVAALDRRASGEEILWVNYDDSISMHRVINTNLKERRLQRLATPTPLDNRISYGCINVPAKFYENVVSPAFSGTQGIVYVLPETRSARAVFASYDVEEHACAQSASQPAHAQVASQSGALLSFTGKP